MIKTLLDKGKQKVEKLKGGGEREAK